MPHFVNVGGMRETLFLLLQLCMGSRQFCEKYRIDRTTERPTEFDWDYYAGNLKSAVCDGLIQISTKLRILQDIVRDAGEDFVDDGFNLANVDEHSRKGLTVASDVSDSVPLSVREACNKVLHATETTLDWEEVPDPPFEFWTGAVWLMGRRTELIGP